MWPVELNITDIPWEVSSENAYDGEFCLKAANTANGDDYTAFTMIINFTTKGVISFYRKTSFNSSGSNSEEISSSFESSSESFFFFDSFFKII